MKNIIFGAGSYGTELLKLLNNVAYFLDNASEKQGTYINKIPVYPVEKILNEHDEYMIWIASLFHDDMELQLQDMGITKYRLFFSKKKNFGKEKELILDLFHTNIAHNDEKSWNEKIQKDDSRYSIRRTVQKIHDRGLLFHWVEIETVNRCNGTCDFCPVSAGNDTRQKNVMSLELFKKIIGELKDLNYGGYVAFFSNNEPFLDLDIQDKIKYAREQIPFAHSYLFTNGSLLSLNKLLHLLPFLDEVFIDNYTEDGSYIPLSKEIVSYYKEHPEIAEKITICLRNPHEILTTRGGNAPNRVEIVSYPKETCVLPFRQVVIRPDGKLSLCCNDALGRYTLGDLTKERLIDIWKGKSYREIRSKINLGRGELEMCRSCDTFYPFQ